MTIEKVGIFTDNKFMKKLILSFLFIFMSFNFFSMNLPEELEGIWEGKDRYVFFEKNKDETVQLVVVLKEFYNWYLDRAAEPENWNDESKRPRNDSTPVAPVKVLLDFKKIDPEKNISAWEISFDYSKFEKVTIPVCVINNKMYLDFYVRNFDPEEKTTFENLNGLWNGVSVSSGIKVSPQTFEDKLSCYYIDNKKIYDIRYWLSDMDYSDEEALFKYNDDSFYVSRHVKSCSRIYSCTSGRSKKIRNPQPPLQFNSDSFVTNQNKTVLVKSNVYLTKLVDKNGMNDLLKIVNEQNSKRAPYPKSPWVDRVESEPWTMLRALEFHNELLLENQQLLLNR